MKFFPKHYDVPSQYLWTDIPHAKSAVAEKIQSTDAADPLLSWIDNGYAILPSAAEDNLIDAFTTQVQTVLASGNQSVRMTYWDRDGHHLEAARAEKLSCTEAKVLDLHDHFDIASQLVFSARILDFLKVLFEDEVVAFQSLYFEYGSGQGAHQDTAFVLTEPPMHFAASTIALEDVSTGRGELFLYPGSQKLDDLIFDGGGKAFKQSDPDSNRYSTLLETAARASGLRRTPHLPAKGDVLLWAADLIHGGEPHSHVGTRRSLVTHYCPRGAIVPYVRHSGREPRQVGPGAWVVAQNGR
jgi:ectoine hydroxylase-related dioxygenase (phytanoyl-CoA dioxygenase family)